MPRRRVLSVDAALHSGSMARWEDALSLCVGRASPAMREQEDASCMPTSDHSFSGRIEFGELGETSLCRIVTTAHRFRRSMREGAAHLASSLPLLLVTQIRGSSRFEHGERCGTLRPGDWCLLDARRRFDWAAWTVGEQAVVALERPSDPEIRALVDQGIGCRWDSKTGLSRVVQTVLSEAFGQLDHLTPQGARGLERAITSLTWDALREQLTRPSPLQYRDTEAARLKAHIEAHLADPDLSVAAIAHGCGVSVRSVHRTFTADPSGSVSSYLWQRRLCQSAATLRDAQEAHRSITDICLGWGFTSPSHFSRLFKEQYGVSPRAYRALD